MYNININPGKNWLCDRMILRHFKSVNIHTYAYIDIYAHVYTNLYSI